MTQTATLTFNDTVDNAELAEFAAYVNHNRAKWAQQRAELKVWASKRVQEIIEEHGLVAVDGGSHINVGTRVTTTHSPTTIGTLIGVNTRSGTVNVRWDR